MRGELDRPLRLWPGCCRMVEVAHAEQAQCAAPVLQLPLVNRFAKPRMQDQLMLPLAGAGV